MSAFGNQRILIFNVNWVGDVLFSTATIRNIKYNYPDSFIACIIPSRCYPVLEGNPYLDQIIIFDENNEHQSLIAKLKFIFMLRSMKFDMVFLLHRSLTRALITWLAGIPVRIGYYSRKRSLLLTKNIMPAPHDTVHRIDYYLNLIERSGLKVKDRFTQFFLSTHSHGAVDEFLRKNAVTQDDFVVGINPGGNWGPKRWSKENYALLAEALAREFGAKVIITGSPDDTSLAYEIQSLMKTNVLFACGELDLKEFAALCKRFDVFISADTGPLHIANAVGTKKIIALFGPTHPLITGPFPQDNVTILQKKTVCRIPCYVADCSTNRCMQVIKPEDVLEQIRSFRAAV
ncbi:MAG: lipopolysaccharide heptosyltransferase II [Candidatus Omnitrophota bacterium]|jgi:lipopolysaccharide heptosyltransferase II